MSQDSTPAFSVSKDKRFSMPLAFLLSLLAGTAISYAALTTLQNRVEAHDRAIVTLQDEARTTREFLIRIDENVKHLRLQQQVTRPNQFALP